MKSVLLRRLPLAGALALPLAFGAGSASAQVSVDVNVTLEGIVILNYFNVIDVTIPATIWGGIFNAPCANATLPSAGVACPEGNAGALTVTGSGSGITATRGPWTPIGSATPLNNLPLTLANVWAVRAIANAGGGNVQVAVTTSSDPLVHSAGGGVQITFAGTPSATPATFAAPGLVTPQFGNVNLGLNMTAATRAGLYSSTAGTDYTLSVTLL